MLLKFPNTKPNTQTVQFRIDPDTKKQMTFLRNHYGVTTGILLKEMIRECYRSVIVPKQKPSDPFSPSKPYNP